MTERSERCTVIKESRVRFLADSAWEFSSPELTFCADSYWVSIPAPCYRSGTLKTPVKSTGDSLHLNTYALSYNEVGVRWLCWPGIECESIRKISSHATRQWILVHSSLRSLSHSGMTLTSRVELACASLSPLKKKKAHEGNDLLNRRPKSSHV